MKILFNRFTILIFSVFIAMPIAAQDVDGREADRKQLVAMLAAVEGALNKQDFEAVKMHVHPEAIITFHDATVAEGTAAIEAYFNDKLGGSSAVLTDFSTKAKVDSPATFYGDIAIASGQTIDKFVFATGNEFELLSRWTATAYKNDGQWSVVALHLSANLFDNPLLNASKNSLIVVGVIAFFVGLLLMLGVMKITSRKS